MQPRCFYAYLDVLITLTPCESREVFYLQRVMGYLEQRDQWLQQHQNATIEEAWEAGYFQSTENWCKKTR